MSDKSITLTWNMAAVQVSTAALQCFLDNSGSELAHRKVRLRAACGSELDQRLDEGTCQEQDVIILV